MAQMPPHLSVQTRQPEVGRSERQKRPCLSCNHSCKHPQTQLQSLATLLITVEPNNENIGGLKRLCAAKL